MKGEDTEVEEGKGRGKIEGRERGGGREGKGRTGRKEKERKGREGRKGR